MESYYQDVIFNELVPCLNNNKQENNIAAELSWGYELDFGYCHINRLKKKCFEIKNYSTIDTYKFQFRNNTNFFIDSIMFTPSMGHLKPQASKRIIATFFTRKPTNNKSDNNNITIFYCQLMKIRFICCDNENDTITTIRESWDQRHDCAAWDSDGDVSLHNVSSSLDEYSLINRQSKINSEDCTSYQHIRYLLLIYLFMY